MRSNRIFVIGLLAVLGSVGCKTSTGPANGDRSTDGSILLFATNVTDTTDLFYLNTASGGTYAGFDSTTQKLVVHGFDSARHIAIEIDFMLHFGGKDMVGSYMTGGIDPPDASREATVIYTLANNTAVPRQFRPTPHVSGSAELTVFDTVHKVVSGTFNTPVNQVSPLDTTFTNLNASGSFTNVPIAQHVF